MEKRFTISDAAKQLSLEAHVLRYWELELGLQISRNPQGHRFYVQEDIALLEDIKQLKEQGFQLKALKSVLSDIHQICKLPEDKLCKLRDELNRQLLDDATPEHTQHSAQIMPLHPQNTYTICNTPTVHDADEKEAKLRHFEAMMRKMIRATVEELENKSEERICEAVSTKLVKEINYLSRQRDELQQKQMELLQEILAQVRQEVPEVAASHEQNIHTLQTRKNTRNKANQSKKKVFAK